MQFSQKIGKTPVDTALQVDSANETLRSALWNILYRTILEDPHKPTYNKELLDDLWEFFYKLPVDERPQPKHALVQLKHWVVNTDWFKLYDLLEFIVGSIQPSRIIAFESACNKVLERERSAFRLLKGIVIPITDMVEFRAVMEASDLLDEYGLDACRSHFATAVGEISRRGGVADYELAILEAGRAVRALFAEMVDGDQLEGTTTLQQVNTSAPLPGGLKNALASLFMLETAPNGEHLFDTEKRSPGLEEARLMVVMASATINYLLAFAGPPPEPQKAVVQKRLTGGALTNKGSGES
ncbi:hypothetical protein KQI63_10865 [bacterium]|nr:hypothetical protein [bacterium]